MASAPPPVLAKANKKPVLDPNNKPPHAPDIEKWQKKGGTVEVLENGHWKYTDWEGNVVYYKPLYPDFTPYQRQEVKINMEGNHTTDYKKLI